MARRRPGSRLDDPLFVRLVGQSFVTRISDHDPARAPLRIGKQVWSTHDLATQLGVVHTRAARLLSEAANAIGAKDVRDLYKRSSPYTFAGVQGLGETTMYVLWRLFESAGLDPDRWANSGERDDALVSFRSLKHREQQAEARTVKAERGRQRRERAGAHERAVAAELSTK
jgi:hypothetical protein